MVKWLKNHYLIAALLALSAIIVLTATAPQIGLTWDEPAYIAAAESYIEWLGLLVKNPALARRADQIEFYWQANPEHPPLDKVWSGCVWAVARHLFDDLTAHRLGNILLVGLLVSLLYLVVAQNCGQMAGLAAVAALMTMPRFFFHAHLAALDMPAAVAVFLSTFAFWHARDRPAWGWDLLMGLTWGLALSTKVNAVFVPPTLLLWMLIFRRRLYLFRRLAVMGLVGMGVFLATWPWLYDQFWPRLDWYIRFVTVDHWKIGQWYLGQFHMPPPWHFPFVIVLVVVPLALTLLYLIGTVRVAKEKTNQALGSLFILSALTPLVIPVIGKSLLYDNDRLFMPAFPYLAALAGLGFAWLAVGLSKIATRITSSRRAARWLSALATVGLAAAAFVPHTVQAAGLYPHLLSYYSEAIGGLRGAALLQLETTYWCETYAVALPYLNRHARPGDLVWVDPLSHDVMFYYQLQGTLRKDLFIAWPEQASSVFWRKDKEGILARIEEADFVIVQYRQTGFGADLRRWLNGREPMLRLEYQGVPLMEVYEQR